MPMNQSDQLQLLTEIMTMQAQSGGHAKTLRIQAWGLWADGSGARAEESLGVLAKAAGCSPSTILSWEQGESKPTVGEALRWLHCLWSHQLVNLHTDRRPVSSIKAGPDA
jgi:hypothetical protein